MEDEKLFTSYRWHEDEDVGAVVVGYEEQTEKEKEESKKTRF